MYAVEGTLLLDLDEAFSPSMIIKLDPSKIKRIAEETEENRGDRKEAQQKLSVLQNSLSTCRQFGGQSIPGTYIFIGRSLWS